MTVLSMENPVFVTYMITGAIMILKLMGQGWMTVFRMLKVDAGFVTPEEIGLIWTINQQAKSLKLLSSTLAVVGKFRSV